MLVYLVIKLSLVHRFGQIIEKCLPREGGDPSLQQAGGQCRNGFPPSRERQSDRNDEQGLKLISGRNRLPERNLS